MTDITVKIKATYTPDIKAVTIKSDAKVEDIMKEIEKYSSIPPSSQKLIYKGKILKPEEPISTYKIENDTLRNPLILLISSDSGLVNPIQ